MKTIELTQGKVALVDDCDYAYLMQWKWYYGQGYAKRRKKSAQVCMYKVILERMGHTPRKRLNVRYKLDYRRDILVPPLDLSPGPKEIPLTQGKAALVDFEDYEYLMQWSWCASNGFAVRSKGGKNFPMYVAILDRMGYKPKRYLNLQGKFDYCRSNLNPPLDMSPGEKKIPISDGSYVSVDLEDYAYLMQFSWSASGGYPTRNVNGKKLKMHREILARMGFIDFQDGDHRDRDPSNNRRKNLRPATRRQNMMNRTAYFGYSSEYKGVSWNKASQKWRAYIKLDSKQRHLGLHDNEEDAAQAYNTAAEELFGEFANLNSIQEMQV